ncbi:MAG: hypothetical protein WD904_14305 [Dehalococcoidia bacterium]
MPEITVASSETAEGWVFDVRVSEDGKETKHQVWLTRAHHDRLASSAQPEELVRASFEFLLQREPKESILNSFELTEISRYFPNYEKEVRWLIRR